MRASRRAKIALALAVETCCDTMIAARPASPALAPKRRQAADLDQAVDQFRILRAQALNGLVERSLVGDRRPGMIDARWAAARRRVARRRRLVHPLRRSCSPTPPPRPILRFAPSPNGALHLGHAYSALSQSPPRGRRRADACCCALKTWIARVASRNTSGRLWLISSGLASGSMSRRVARANMAPITRPRSPALAGARPCLSLFLQSFGSRAGFAGTARSRRRAALFRALPRASSGRTRSRRLQAGERAAFGSTWRARSLHARRFPGANTARGRSQPSARPNRPPGATSCCAAEISRRAITSRWSRTMRSSA